MRQTSNTTDKMLTPLGRECPRCCDNNFLAVPDNMGGQERKCHKCGYSVALQSRNRSQTSKGIVNRATLYAIRYQGREARWRETVLKIEFSVASERAKIGPTVLCCYECRFPMRMSKSNMRGASRRIMSCSQGHSIILVQDSEGLFTGWVTNSAVDWFSDN